MNDLEKSWQNFCQSGDFLAFTRQWENGIPQPLLLQTNHLNISLIDSGILVVEPLQPSSTEIIISSGIHGNETAPMEIVNQMVKDIIAEKLTVKARLMLIIGNPAAVNMSQRFLSQNLNRLFSARYMDSANEDYETKRASIIEQAVENFYHSKQCEQRYHFDLHTAIRASKYEKFVLYPYLHERPWDKQHIAFFGGAEITTVLLGNQPAGTFSYYTSQYFNAKSATVELGKVMPFGQNNMQNFAAIDGNLRHLISAEKIKTLAFNNEKYKVFKVKQEILKANDDYRLRLDDDVENFTDFQKGTLLASDNKNENYVVENDGEAIVFPNNNVPVGQRVGVLLERVKI